MPSTRTVWISLASVAALAGGAGAVVAVKSGKWAKWRAARYASRAEALAQSGANEAARAACLQALKFDRDSVKATRTLLAVLPPGDLRSALLLRSRIADLDPTDQANLRLLAHTAILVRRFDLAHTATRDLERAAGKTTDVLDLRARLALAQGDHPGAIEAAQSLLAQNPGHPAGRLILALSRLFSGQADAKVESELTELSKTEGLRMEALRGLREIALRRGDHSRALELAGQVVKEPSVEFTDWLARADLAVKTDPNQLDPQISELTQQAGSNPKALGLIATWLRSRGAADRIEPWVKSAEALKKDPATAQMIRAEALAATGQWEQLDALLPETKWPGLEFLQDALGARASRGRNDEAAAAQRWRRAVQAALERPENARMLAETVRPWPGWNNEYENLLWRIEKTGPQAQAWALTELSRLGQQRRDTRMLRRVSEEMCKAFPDNVPARNNLAFYSLLLEDAPERAHRIAEELRSTYPTEPPIVSTYALSLLRQNRPAEALAALEKLPPKALQDNAIAVYYAVALNQTGQREKATGIAAQIATDKLLPEELALLKPQP